jgi:hypothetical protein
MSRAPGVQTAPIAAVRSPNWIKVKNLASPAMQWVMEAFG